AKPQASRHPRTEGTVMKPQRRLLLWSSVLALGASLASPAWTQSAQSAANAAKTDTKLASTWAGKPWEGKRWAVAAAHPLAVDAGYQIDRKSTRLNSSHVKI